MIYLKCRKNFATGTLRSKESNLKNEPSPNNKRANLNTLETDQIADSGFVNNSGINVAFSNVPYLTATFECTAYANQLKIVNSLQVNHSPIPPEREEFDIKEFSKGSRRRLFSLITSLDYTSYGKPIFVSATWHDDYHNTRKEIKTHLDNFHKRLKRNLPPFHLIWKLEYQKRGAPHFHFVLFPLDSSYDFNNIKDCQKIFRHWMELKECNCKNCKLYAMRITPLNDFVHTMIYISKELGKITQNEQHHNLGRIWAPSRNIRIREYKKVEMDFKTLSKLLQKICDQNDLNKNLLTFIQAVRMYGFSSKIFIPYEMIRSALLDYQQIQKQSSKKVGVVTIRKYNFRKEPQ